VVPDLDEPPDRVAALKPRFSRTVFWAIIATGFVCPWLLVTAVDSYLATDRLRGFLAIYTDTPGIYLLLFLSQALWSAMPFVAFAVLAQKIYDASAGEEAMIFIPRRTGVIVAGCGSLVVLCWIQVVAWGEYFTSSSGSLGIAIALGLPPLVALVVMPILYALGWMVGEGIAVSKAQ
jgi:hypothetical protein